jgi:hypothetical protein
VKVVVLPSDGEDADDDSILRDQLLATLQAEAATGQSCR